MPSNVSPSLNKMHFPYAYDAEGNVILDANGNPMRATPEQIQEELAWQDLQRRSNTTIPIIDRSQYNQWGLPNTQEWNVAQKGMAPVERADLNARLRDNYGIGTVAMTGADLDFDTIAQNKQDYFKRLSNQGKQLGLRPSGYRLVTYTDPNDPRIKGKNGKPVNNHRTLGSLMRGLNTMQENGTLDPELEPYMGDTAFWQNPTLLKGDPEKTYVGFLRYYPQEDKGKHAKDYYIEPVEQPGGKYRTNKQGQVIQAGLLSTVAREDQERQKYATGFQTIVNQLFDPNNGGYITVPEQQWIDGKPVLDEQGQYVFKDNQLAISDLSGVQVDPTATVGNVMREIDRADNTKPIPTYSDGLVDNVDAETGLGYDPLTQFAPKGSTIPEALTIDENTGLKRWIRAGDVVTDQFGNPIKFKTELDYPLRLKKVQPSNPSLDRYLPEKDEQDNLVENPNWAFEIDPTAKPKTIVSPVYDGSGEIQRYNQEDVNSILAAQQTGKGTWLSHEAKTDPQADYRSPEYYLESTPQNIRVGYTNLPDSLKGLEGQDISSILNRNFTPSRVDSNGNLLPNTPVTIASYSQPIMAGKEGIPKLGHGETAVQSGYLINPNAVKQGTGYETTEIDLSKPYQIKALETVTPTSGIKTNATPLDNLILQSKINQTRGSVVPLAPNSPLAPFNDFSGSSRMVKSWKDDDVFKRHNLVYEDANGLNQYSPTMTDEDFYHSLGEAVGNRPVSSAYDIKSSIVQDPALVTQMAPKQEWLKLNNAIAQQELNKASREEIGSNPKFNSYGVEIDGSVIEAPAVKSDPLARKRLSANPNLRVRQFDKQGNPVLIPLSEVKSKGGYATVDYPNAEGYLPDTERLTARDQVLGDLVYVEDASRLAFVNKNLNDTLQKYGKGNYVVKRFDDHTGKTSLIPVGQVTEKDVDRPILLVDKNGNEVHVREPYQKAYPIFTTDNMADKSYASDKGLTNTEVDVRTLYDQLSQQEKELGMQLSIAKSRISPKNTTYEEFNKPRIVANIKQHWDNIRRMDVDTDTSNLYPNLDGLSVLESTSGNPSYNSAYYTTDFPMDFRTSEDYPYFVNRERQEAAEWVDWSSMDLDPKTQTYDEWTDFDKATKQFIADDPLSNEYLSLKQQHDQVKSKRQQLASILNDYSVIQPLGEGEANWTGTKWDNRKAYDAQFEQRVIGGEVLDDVWGKYITKGRVDDVAREVQAENAIVNKHKLMMAVDPKTGTYQLNDPEAQQYRKNYRAQEALRKENEAAITRSLTRTPKVRGINDVLAQRQAALNTENDALRNELREAQIANPVYTEPTKRQFSIDPSVDRASLPDWAKQGIINRGRINTPYGDVATPPRIFQQQLERAVEADKLGVEPSSLLREVSYPSYTGEQTINRDVFQLPKSTGNPNGGSVSPNGGGRGVFVESPIKEPPLEANILNGSWWNRNRKVGAGLAGLGLATVGALAALGSQRPQGYYGNPNQQPQQQPVYY